MASDASSPPGPRRSRRAATAYAAARLHFEEGLSQADIAERLSVSRSTVSRLLTHARETGIVRIELHPPVPELALREDLTEVLSLRRIVLAPGGPGGAPSRLVAPALKELTDLELRPGQVLALGWGRSLWELAGERFPPLDGVWLVPAVGGIAQTERPFQSNEIVRRAAEHSGALAHFLHAPALPGAELRRALLADPAIDAVTSLWDRLDAAIIGIGVPAGQPGSYGPSHVADVADAETQAAFRHAAGDILTRYFDLAGRPVAYPAEEGLLAVTREQLQAAGTVIGMAAGPDKARPIVGAARAGLLDVLVTDSDTAAAALELAEAMA